MRVVASSPGSDLVAPTVTASARRVLAAIARMDATARPSGGNESFTLAYVYEFLPSGTRSEEVQTGCTEVTRNHGPRPFDAEWRCRGLPSAREVIPRRSGDAGSRCGAAGLPSRARIEQQLRPSASRPGGAR